MKKEAQFNDLLTVLIVIVLFLVVILTILQQREIEKNNGGKIFDPYTENKCLEKCLQFCSSTKGEFSCSPSSENWCKKEVLDDLPRYVYLC